jgi:WhiB family transcriptional regulator, redox-sensing transcriptional regulator
MFVDAWQQRAACRNTDPNLFFTPDGPEPTLAKGNRIAAALAICAGCPVRKACLADAVAADDRFAIRGGTTPEDRGYWSTDGTRRRSRHPAKGAA